MRWLLVGVFAALVIQDVRCAMTEAQVASAAKLLRNVCQPKTKVSNAQIDALHQGNFDDPALQCYMECILRTGQLLKDGKLNYDSAKTQMANLPPSIAGRCLATLENCKDSMQNGDKCAAAAEFYKCFYEDDPANFFLP